MSPTSRGTGPLSWGPCVLFLLIMQAALWSSSYAEKSKFYHMQSLCKNHFLQQLYRKIDGAVLWSQNERNLDCVITFQTHSVLQRFMLRFDMLQLDCNDHLYIYDGAHAGGAHKADLTCRNTKESVGAIFPRSNLVTLKYVTDGWGTDSNGFKLVITAVKEPKHACKDFRCTLREFCIHKDLVCDGVDHCADGSDEAASTLCQNTNNAQILGLDVTWFIVVLVSSLLVLCASAVSITICYCRRGQRHAAPHTNNTQIQLQQVYGSNGAMKHSLPRGTTLLHQSPSQGNWVRPATSGFHESPQAISSNISSSISSSKQQAATSLTARRRACCRAG